MHKKMRCENFGCKRNWSWLGFGLAMVGGLGFFALVAKLVNKWSYGFCAIYVGELSQMHQKWGVKRMVAKGIDLGWVLALPRSADWVFLPWSQNWWISEVMGFVQSWWGIVTNASEMRCEKFGCKRKWSWFGFGFAKFDGLGFFARVAKLVNKWSYGFCAI